MKIRVTNHCRDQIVKRKKWKNSDNKRKKAIFFAIDVFWQLINKNSYKWTWCIIKKDNDDKYKVYHKQTWYKFVYHYNDKKNEYTLITFMIVSPLDLEIWKILRTLRLKE